MKTKSTTVGAFIFYLQSYLLIINSDVLEFYYQFLKTYKFVKICNYDDKQKLINELEIGLFNKLLNSGLKCGVLFNVKKDLY